MFGIQSIKKMLETQTTPQQVTVFEVKDHAVIAYPAPINEAYKGYTVKLIALKLNVYPAEPMGTVRAFVIGKRENGSTFSSYVLAHELEAVGEGE
jgi:hypothetical protein